jgi:hypothetical protein
MEQYNDSFLEHAEGLIRSGRGPEAVDGLIGYLNRNPQSEDGWFLLSQAVSDLRQKEDCLKQVLKLNPSRREARDRLHLVQDLSRSQGKKGVRAYTTSISSQGWDSGESQLWGEESALSGGLRTEKMAPVDLIKARLKVIKARIDKLTGIQHGKVKPWQAAVPYILIFLTLGGCLLLSLVFLVIKYDEKKLAWSATQTQAYRFVLPATWTHTPVPPPTETLIPTPTRTPTASPTFPVPGPTSAAVISTIQAQVSELRRLSIAVTPAVYLGDRGRIGGVLTGVLGEEAVFIDPETKSKSLYLLGLVPQDYDLDLFMANSLGGGLGGFYHPRRNEIYLNGLRISSIESYTYAHEYTHALTSYNFRVADHLLNPICRYDNQRCKAYQALVEGDGVLLAQQWLHNKANPEAYRQLVNNMPSPGLSLPDPEIPTALVEDLLFPYTKGLEFVRALYNRGGWSEVDRAYLDPPETTEQILHPDKYWRREGALVVDTYLREQNIGTGWYLKDWGIMGEWMTYLILAHSVDPGGRLEEAVAASASAGWGGDLYQLFEGPDPSQWIMAVRWIWDTPGAAVEFENALNRRLAGRIEAVSLQEFSGNCWEAVERLDCIVSVNGTITWTAAPNYELMERVLNLIP